MDFASARTRLSQQHRRRRFVEAMCVVVGAGFAAAFGPWPVGIAACIMAILVLLRWLPARLFSSDVDGLLEAAVAVEQQRAVGGPAIKQAVLARGAARLRSLRVSPFRLWFPMTGLALGLLALIGGPADLGQRGGPLMAPASDAPLAPLSALAKAWVPSKRLLSGSLTPGGEGRGSAGGIEGEGALAKARSSQSGGLQGDSPLSQWLPTTPNAPDSIETEPVEAVALSPDDPVSPEVDAPIGIVTVSEVHNGMAPVLPPSFAESGADGSTYHRARRGDEAVTEADESLGDAAILAARGVAKVEVEGIATGFDAEGRVRDGTVHQDAAVTPSFAAVGQGQASGEDFSVPFQQRSYVRAYFEATEQP